MQSLGTGGAILGIILSSNWLCLAVNAENARFVYYLLENTRNGSLWVIYADWVLCDAK